jgi:hypothetical protein
MSTLVHITFGPFGIDELPFILTWYRTKVSILFLISYLQTRPPPAHRSSPVIRWLPVCRLPPGITCHRPDLAPSGHPPTPSISRAPLHPCSARNRVPPDHVHLPFNPIWSFCINSGGLRRSPIPGHRAPGSPRFGHSLPFPGPVEGLL